MRTHSSNDPLVITGATGAVGWSLVRALLAREPGRPLRLLVRPTAGASAEDRVRALFPDARWGPDGVEVWAADLTRPLLGLSRRDQRRATRGAAAVVHLAARTDFKGTGPGAYTLANVDGALRAAALALAAGAPLIHVSTAYVAGDLDDTLREDDLDRGQGFHNGYERSKFEAERRLLDLSRDAGLRLVRVRPGVVLPDAPVDGVPEGPGPLTYLRLLSNLRPSPREQESRQQASRALRATGSAAGQLNLVPAPWVADVLRGVVALGSDAGPCYHATAARPFSMGDLIEHLHRAVPGVRLVPTERLDAPDTLERLVDRAGAVYAPYRRLRARWDRSRLEADLPALAEDGATPAWLDRIFAAHLTTWRAAPRAAGPRPDARAVAAYFDEHLAPLRGRVLIPGLSTLTSTFTLTVHDVGRWRVELEAGRLVAAMRLPAEQGPAGVDYALGAAAFLEAVAGARSPQALFFSRAVSISGRIPEGLATATALEEFFRTFPWTPGRAAGELYRAQERSA